MKTVLIALAVFFSGVNLLYSQASPPGGGTAFNSYPIPPNPNAASLGKYTEMPVSKSTGIPQISVPIYSFSDDKSNLSLGISLSYHAGGNKVEDMASNIGLGWSMMAGGSISRVTNGIPDEIVNGYLSTPVLRQYKTDDFTCETTGWDQVNNGQNKGISVFNTNLTEYDSIANFLSKSDYDTQADIFNVSCGGISTTFFFDKAGSIIYSGPQNIKIYKTISNYSITNFLIVDNKGTKYYFGLPEYTVTDNEQEPAVPAAPAANSSWYLTKIESFDGQSQILFEYINIGQNLMYRTNFASNWVTKLSDPPQTIETSTNSVTSSPYGAKNVSRILLPDSTVVQFNYNLNRLDYVGDKALTSVLIQNDSYSKKFSLYHSYFESDYCANYSNGCTPAIAYPPNGNDEYKRLRLDSVAETNLNNAGNTYRFEYDAAKLPVRNSKQQDWWGLYSTAVQEPASITDGISLNMVANTTPTMMTRKPKLEDARAWVLNKITFPTGGYTHFEYELNQVKSSITNTTVAAGGLRVAKVKTYDATGGVEETGYTYTNEDGTCSGRLLMYPFYNWYCTNSAAPAQGTIATVSYFNYNLAPTQTLANNGGSPLMYDRVEEQKTGPASQGKTVYEFLAPTTNNQWDFKYPFIDRQLYDWTVALPLRTSVFNANNQLISKTENEYYILNNELQNVLLGTPSTPARDARRNLKVCVYSNSEAYHNGRKAILYGAREYFVTVGRSLLKKETQTQFDMNGSNPLVASSEYFYDAAYDLMKKVVKTANGRELESRFYYPFDYTNTGLGVRAQLLAANRVNNLISNETWQQKQGQYALIESGIFEYGDVNGIAREKMLYKARATQPVSEAQFGLFNPNSLIRNSYYNLESVIEQYDTRGRVLEHRQHKNVPVAYIWGNGTATMLAKAENANYGDIGFASFETNEISNNTLSGISTGSIVTGGCVTGKRYYSSGAIQLSKTGLNAGKQYVVSYWTLNNPLTVTGTLAGYPKLLRTYTKDGVTWKLYEHKTGTGNTSIFISGSGSIDEVRICPADGAMTTITSNPLVGVLTVCTPNHQVQYYEYDGLNRLTTVRNQNGHIVKKICYKYNGQPEDCGL